jgi:hypothetical protein
VSVILNCILSEPMVESDRLYKGSAKVRTLLVRCGCGLGGQKPGSPRPEMG